MFIQADTEVYAELYLSLYWMILKFIQGYTQVYIGLYCSLYRLILKLIRDDTKVLQDNTEVYTGGY